MAVTRSNFDERLSEEVRKCGILYDKSLSDFKNTRMKDEAWRNIAQSLGLRTGKEASNCFKAKNPRNRYARDKKKIGDKKVSGAGRADVEEAENQSSELFRYLRWLDPYIKKRQTTSNLLGNSLLRDESHEEEDIEDTRQDDTDEADMERSVTPSTDTSSGSLLQRNNRISETTGQTKYRKKKCFGKEADDAEIEVIKMIGNKLESKTSLTPKQEQDEDDMSCQLLASQLRKLQPNDKLLAKMQINNIIYNYLMKCNENIPIGSSPSGQSQFLQMSNIPTLHSGNYQKKPCNVIQSNRYNLPNDVSGRAQFDSPSYSERAETRQYFSPEHLFRNKR